MALLKGTRLAEIAIENGLPAISMVQSAGANLSQQVLLLKYSFKEL
jgi:acetyl-CoA carboxylase carboxyltransferase component